jgi:beta-glucosidase/6-phospho-beta-glucosidase/beta-galactosidase
MRRPLAASAFDGAQRHAPALASTRRWGITRVDFDTLKRTQKSSAHWYSGVIAGNRVTS